MNRRIMTMLLAAVMLLTLAACNKNGNETAATAESTEEIISAAIEIPENFFDQTKPAEEETVIPEAEAATEATAESTVPEVTEEVPAATEETTAKPTAPAVTVTEYEWYNALSGEEQMAFMETFDSMAAFFDWYNAAKAEYERLHPSIDIGDGNIDLGDLIGGNG